MPLLCDKATADPDNSSITTRTVAAAPACTSLVRDAAPALAVALAPRRVERVPALPRGVLCFLLCFQREASIIVDGLFRSPEPNGYIFSSVRRRRFPLIQRAHLIASAAMHSRFLLCALAACGPGDREGSANHPDAAVHGAPDAAMVCYEGATEVEVALMIQIEESCAIWNSLGELGGRATVTRAGTMLTIDFGTGVVFSGTLANNAVNLRYEHMHPFSDGCGWKATETLVGTLDPRSCNFALSYDYVESVVMNNGGCASPCSAMANVQLELKPVIL
jgi:hypothetical protein